MWIFKHPDYYRDAYCVLQPLVYSQINLALTKKLTDYFFIDMTYVPGNNIPRSLYIF